MKCESGRFSLRSIDARARLTSRPQEVEEIRPRFFPPTVQEHIHLSTYLSINLPTYLPSYPATYVSIRRNIQFSLMPQSVTPWSCFYTKQRNPSLVVVVVFVDISSFPVRSRAGDPTLFLSTFLRSQLWLSSARKYKGEGGRVSWPGDGEKGRFSKMATTS